MEQNTLLKMVGITKTFPGVKALDGVNLEVKRGTVHALMGENGAGKSTTLRHLMGFSKPDLGNLSISDLDCWKDKTTIKKDVGYLPGEIALPDDMSGMEYLKLIDKLRKTNDLSYANELIEYFEIDSSVKIKKMSKGMKQKIAIIMAFMHDPDILLLDEPTSGLDVISSKVIIDFVKEEKGENK